jgi:hypothetical protein
VSEKSIPVAAWKRLHGYWSEYPDYPVNDWKDDVANDGTKQGYWEWVEAQEEEREV